MIAAVIAGLTVTQVQPVRMIEKTIGSTPVRTMVVELNDPRVRIGVVVAQGFPGTDEPFSSMVKRSGVKAAVNGAYFDKGTKRPIGDIVVDGKLLHSGRMGTALTLDQSGNPDIDRVVRHKTYKWEGFQHVLACGPALVLDGKVDVDFVGEGFRDPHVTGRTQRMAIGYTSTGQLIVAHIRKSVTFEEAAKVMRQLGCFEAMNLDAGASLAMYHDGKSLQSPGRKLTNILGIWVQ